jgi:hypothetical protein
MTENLEDHTPEEIAHGTTDFVMYLEECDSMECIYSHEALMAGSVELYNFADKK